MRISSVSSLLLGALLLSVSVNAEQEEKKDNAAAQEEKKDALDSIEKLPGTTDTDRAYFRDHGLEFILNDQARFSEFYRFLNKIPNGLIEEL